MSIVTKSNFSAELGVTASRVSQYLKKGMPVREDGKLDREAALKWLKQNSSNPSPKDRGLSRAVSLAADDTPSDASTFEVERTRKLKLQNDETERALIRIADAIDSIDAICGPIPSELAQVAVRVTDDPALRRRIEDEIDIALNEVSGRILRTVAALETGSDAVNQGAADDPDGMGEQEPNLPTKRRSARQA